LRRPLAAGVVPLRRLDRWQAETLREQLADLYVESSHAKPGQEYRGREEFLRRLAADVRRPGFDMVIAQGTSLVGCAFGFPLARDGSWWQEFTGPLPENLEQLTASGHVFACAELMIHPHEHVRDLGLRLQDGLLAHQDASRRHQAGSGRCRDLRRILCRGVDRNRSKRRERRGGRSHATDGADEAAVARRTAGRAHSAEP